MSLPLLLAQQTGGPAADLNFGLLALQMIAVLAFVLLLVYVVLRKVLPFFVPGAVNAAGNQTVRVLERLPIDQRRSILVVKVQDRVFLIGSAEGQINVLMELDAEKVEALKPKPASPSRGVLDSWTRKVLSRKA